jgi:heptosyltransferase-2
MADETLVIWLPSPLGDAVMATPALRAIRRHFAGRRILFFGSAAIRQVLSPTAFCDGWIEKQAGLWNSLRGLKEMDCRLCILLKNSFGSALTAWLARVPRRIGYARDGRTWMLTESIRPPVDAQGRWVPVPAIDYYLKIAQTLGADASDRTMELAVDPADTKKLQDKLPAIFDRTGPLVILVPGGAFGPSKCWPSERFAQVADRLIQQHRATVVLSVAPNRQEMQIADQICRHAKGPLIHLGQRPLGLGGLKALLARADLVITNDTGPRHIATALKRKVVTLFGPNNPQWTQTGYTDEIQIIGTGPCVPCDKPVCSQTRHYCMESITVEQVFEAAQKQLSGGRG